ncbi:MAG TPA: DnaJ domain-containing protein [Acidobacteriota bacterium]|nr:DnaJ domain-containing protein [Acidobacteriota bacterium]
MKPTPFKRIDDMDLYEVLDIGRDASAGEVAEAHRKAVESYRPGALTSYGLLAEDERRSMLERIDLAYMTLGDDERRRAYDEEAFGAKPPDRPGAAYRRTVERLEIGDADRKTGFVDKLRRLFRRGPRPD